jgi:hypothetical protein
VLTALLSLLGIFRAEIGDTASMTTIVILSMLALYATVLGATVAYLWRHESRSGGTRTNSP